ncbi:hypothetical protein [Thermoproteus uzoniensis]|uniref:hypothetical protein n=1 Tax=Thermoproteus uzoniensis TaxID=184117 RepID=UPI00139156EA|nr:hypothetical protein [Thermoproteus uzoniensis]
MWLTTLLLSITSTRPSSTALHIFVSFSLACPSALSSSWMRPSTNCLNRVAASSGKDKALGTASPTYRMYSLHFSNSVSTVPYSTPRLADFSSTASNVGLGSSPDTALHLSLSFVSTSSTSTYLPIPHPAHLFTWN